VNIVEAIKNFFFTSHKVQDENLKALEHLRDENMERADRLLALTRQRMIEDREWKH
jgi:hypothetical protein